MRKYNVMQEFLDGSFSGCFIVNDGVVYEDCVKELVGKSVGAVYDLIEDELIVYLNDKAVVISHM